MNREQAKAILSIYRAGIDDADPQFSEALAFAGSDPELAEWLGDQQKVFNYVRKTLQDIEVPDELSNKIVRQQPLPFPRRMPVVSIWAAAAALTLFAGIAGFYFHDFTSNRAQLGQERSNQINDGSPVIITGEVLDMACYIASNLSGPEHADCARTCIKNGLPVGIKAPDGKAYLLVGTNEPLNAQLADYAAKTVTVKGIVRKRDGFLMLDQATVEKL